jgi:hypothetical protein
MVWVKHAVICMLTAGLLWPSAAAGQEMPADYNAVPSALGKSGVFEGGVLKVNIPRNDLRVSIRQRPVPAALEFGGWVAFTKAADGMDVMMGDLVLTEDEVNLVDVSGPGSRPAGDPRCTITCGNSRPSSTCTCTA